METIGKSVSSLERIELLDALDHDGCPLCWIVQRATRRYLFHILLSPAQELATRTITTLTFGKVPPHASLLVLAIWESLIGLGLIFGVFLRATLLLLFLQMLGTVTPLFLFPGEVFTQIPFAPTLEGQYIIKNLVLISAGLVLGATVRGGTVIADPEVIQMAKRVPSRDAR